VAHTGAFPCNLVEAEQTVAVEGLRRA
jgi:hypothetical protein